MTGRGVRVGSGLGRGRSLGWSTSGQARDVGRGSWGRDKLAWGGDKGQNGGVPEEVGAGLEYCRGRRGWGLGCGRENRGQGQDATGRDKGGRSVWRQSQGISKVRV